MHLIVIRHGETEDNRKGILRGRPESGLTEVGQQQACQAAILLKDQPIDAIYSSDLRRCVQTAEAVQQYHPDQAINFTPRLRELSGGRTSRLPLWIPGSLVLPVLNLAIRLNVKAPGGETWRDLRSRIQIILNEIYALQPNATVLLVTHAIVIRAIGDSLRVPGKPKVAGNGEVLRFEMERPVRK